MGSQSRSDNTKIERVIDELSLQALAYAEKEFGVGHPIWRSIYEQVTCFCGDPQSCSGHHEDGVEPPVSKSKH